MTAPSGASGRTRCPGCEHLFAADPRPTTTIPGTERRGRPGYSASGPGVHNAYPVEIRWHVECLTDFRARNAALREEARLDRREMVATLATAAGIDVDAALTEFDRLNPEVTP